MIPADPLNITVMDVDEFLKDRRARPIDSQQIYEASSSTFHPTGLWSEEIFGQVGTDDRLSRYGFIDLNCQVLQPIIYLNLIGLSALYEDVITGSAYAIYDSDKKDLVRASETTQGAGTGYSFFMAHLYGNPSKGIPAIEFKETASHSRRLSIAILKMFKSLAFCSRYVVIPAGLRDIKGDNKVLAQDDINKLYQQLMALTLAIPSGSQSPVYDVVRVGIQRKIVEIYDYIETITKGKKGYYQGKYASRRVAMGTRNVISAASYAAQSPDDVQIIYPDETKIGLYQTMKGLQPLVIHHFRAAIIDPIFGAGQTTVPLTDPTTYALTYCEISGEELNKFTSADSIENLISRFRNIDVREKPITVRDIEGVDRYLCLVYDLGSEIYLCRSVDDLKATLKREIDLTKIRPLTWVEAFYMATYRAAVKCHVIITRYPVIEEGSTYPTKIHLATTSPSRVVTLKNTFTDEDLLSYPEFPIFDTAYIDSIIPHLARLKALGADFDGDTTSANFIWSEDANAEIARFLADPQSIFTIHRGLISGGNTDNVAMTLRNLSKPPVPRTGIKIPGRSLFSIADSGVSGKGTFANVNLHYGIDLGLAFTQIGRTGEPDRDYTRTPLGQYTNHRNYPNVRLVRDGNKWHFQTCRDIAAGEEIFIDYRKFPWEGKREFVH